VWQDLAAFTDRSGLDERVVTALHDVAMAGRVRRSRYERAEGISTQQAQRDLRDLAAAQVVRAVGRTRARYYEAGSRFPEAVLTTARTPTVLTDPYAVSRPAAERRGAGSTRLDLVTSE
jgi:hypothetical protein